MSDVDTAAPIDLTAEVAVPEGEVTREQLVKILEDSRKAEPPEEGAEVSAEPAKVEPVAEKKSADIIARITAGRRAELRAKAEREALAADRAAVEAEKAAIAEAKAQIQMLEAAKLSPSKLLELAKKSPKEFLEALANEHEPEAIAQRAMAGTQTELQKLAAELESLKAERAAELQRQRHAEIQKDTQEVGEQFVEFIASNVEKYPALVETWTPAQFVRAGFALLEETGKDASGKTVTRLQAYMAEHDGKPPSNEEIAELLEYRAQPEFKARSAWRERIGKSAPTPSQGNANQGQPVTAAKPRTLTNGASSTNASAPKPWSQKDADEESKRIFEAMYASRADS